MTFFWYKLHIFYSKNTEHWEYISCFTMHVELFLQSNAKAHDIKLKLRPPCNKSNLNLSPPFLGIIFTQYPPSGFSAPLLIIIAQSLPWRHTFPLFWEESLNRGLSVYMFSLPVVLWTIQMHPVSRALISFACCPQCDKNIKYMYLDIKFDISRPLQVCYHMLQIYFFHVLCKIQRHYTIYTTLHYLHNRHYTIYLNQKCNSPVNIWSAIFTNQFFCCLRNWLEKTYQEFYSL